MDGHGDTAGAVSTKAIKLNETPRPTATGNLLKCSETMRKFWQPRQTECQTIKEPIPCMKLPTKKFMTGSMYEGSWEGPWITGRGIYVLPNGVTYKGGFQDGMFEGQGQLLYESGAKVKGRWSKGLISEKVIVFADNLEYDETNWMYLKDNDRRYKTEYDNGVQPSGESYITVDKPCRDVPVGMYDTGDGFFVPQKFVYKNEGLDSILRAPSVKEQKWIEKHCRKGLTGPIGPRPDLYPEWVQPQQELRQPPPPAAKCGSEIKVSKTLSIFDDGCKAAFLKMGDFGGVSDESFNN